MTMAQQVLVVSAAAGFDAGTGEQPLFENLVGPISRQWPADPSRPRSLEIVLDRAARRPERTPDFPCAHAVVVQSQHLPQLPQGQLSSGRHQSPSSLIEGPDARVADPQKRRQPTARVADFKSEPRPASRRNTRPD
jgi:hypothetical protein